jgi:tetratricopeptide (TPR) repeat protein
MKLRDRGGEVRKAILSLVGFLRKESGTWPAHSIRPFLLLAALFAAGQSAVQAQNTPRSTESPLMPQFQQALSLAQHGDRQGAMNLVVRLLEQHPDFAPALKLKGMLLEEAGRAPEAATAYEEGLKLAPNDGDLLLKVGIYKLAAGQKEEALKVLQHCVKVLPSDGDAHYYLAQAYHLNGQDDLALRAIRLSAKAEPDNPSVLQKYGELLCSTKDVQAGLEWLLKAQRLDATLPRLDYDLARAHYTLMDLANAEKFAARAAAASPSDVNALRLLAEVKLKLSKWQEAEDAFQRVRLLKADDAELLLGLGHCQVELKNYPAAVETLQSVLRLEPTQLLAHFYLSRAYAGMGRTADAEHEAALHHLMMDRATFVRSVTEGERENGIRAQVRQCLKEHREQDALRIYSDYLKGTAATPADAHVFIGMMYLFLGNTGDGLRSLHQALKLDPHVRGAHTYEGILALKENDPNKAESEFNAELANDPNYQTAIAELGEVRYHQGRWAEAADQFAKSQTMTPELLYQLCDSYFHLGKTRDADLTAEMVAAYGRNNPELMKELAGLLKSNGQGELAQRLGL